MIAEGYLLDKTNATSVPFFIDFVCSISKEASFFNITYDKDVVLSTLSEIKQVVEHLHENGITNLNIRLLGLNEGGLNRGGIADAFTMKKSVGTTDELIELAALVESKGGHVSVGVDFSTIGVDTLFDSFYKTKQAVRRLDKTVLNLGRFDLVTKKQSDLSLTRYFLSPSLYSNTTSSYMQSMTATLGKDMVGVSWIGVGETLTSDFNKDCEYDRCMTVFETVRALTGITDQTGRQITDGGYLYTWSNSSSVLGMALTDSHFAMSSMGVPFVQMVAHGYLPYAGVALNRAANPTYAMLNSVATGAGLYYQWMTREDLLLANTPYASEMYSLNVDNTIDQAIALYKDYNAALLPVLNEMIHDYRILSSGVTETVFESGYTLLVNHTAQSVIVDGQNLEPYSFTVDIVKTRERTSNHGAENGN